MANDFDLKRTLSELIAFRSTADRPLECRLCFEYLKSLFLGNDFHLEEYSVNGVDSLLVHQGNRNSKVLLFGHYDVVDGEDAQFTAKEDGGRLYGRGALDMKGGIAVLSSLMLESRKNGWDIALALSGDEEVGGFNGIQPILAAGLRPKCVLLPDGGKAPMNVVQKEKGVLWLKIKACGKSAHGSAPWAGTSAIRLLHLALDRIESAFLPADSHPTDHWVTTINIGRIEGGVGFNKVPELACASCDIRYTESEQPEELIKRINEVLPEGVTIEVVMCEPLVFVDPESEIVRAYTSSIRETGLEPAFSLDHGSSDARFFTPLGIPVILNQPLGDGHHSPHEWVDLKSLETYSAIVRRFLDKTAK